MNSGRRPRDLDILGIASSAASVPAASEGSPEGTPSVAPLPPTPTVGTAPIVSIAGQGVTQPAQRRETIYSVNARRCRAWKGHDRDLSWYTPERCSDLIESIGATQQNEAAVARRTVDDPNFDFEIIVGMRRRYSCEYLNKPLKLVLRELTDQEAFVLMYSENKDRQDLMPMERARSVRRQLLQKIFPTQEALGQSIRVSKGMVTQMVRAAEMLEHEWFTKLFASEIVIPVDPAYKLAMLIEAEPKAQAVMAAARNLVKREKHRQMTPTAIMKFLLTAPERSSMDASEGGGSASVPTKTPFNIGNTDRMTLTRNAKGKVTLAFTRFSPDMEEQILAAVRTALKG